MLQSSHAVMFTEMDVDGHLVWHEPGGLRKVSPFSGERSIFLRGRAAVPPHVNDCASSLLGPGVGAGPCVGAAIVAGSATLVGFVITPIT